LDEILESKNEINSRDLTGNILSKKVRTAVEANVLINRFYIIFSLPNAVFPIGPELAARVKIANDLRDVVNRFIGELIGAVIKFENVA